MKETNKKDEVPDFCPKCDENLSEEDFTSVEEATVMGGVMLTGFTCSNCEYWEKW